VSLFLAFSAFPWGVPCFPGLLRRVDDKKNSPQNGNLINTTGLLQFMDAVAHRHINTSSDSELLLNIFADNLNDTGKFRINEEDIFVAVRGLMTQARGAYACVAMLAGFGIIAFRDPNGIRPLGFASRAAAQGGGAKDWLCASESAVADVAGFFDWEDVRPGMFETIFSSARYVVRTFRRGA
jgi:amidophosphoribosyltransferase